MLIHALGGIVVNVWNKYNLVNDTRGNDDWKKDVVPLSLSAPQTLKSSGNTGLLRLT